LEEIYFVIFGMTQDGCDTDSLANRIRADLITLNDGSPID